MLDLTPLEKMLQNAAPLRDDGADRFFGLENVRRTLPTPARVVVTFIIVDTLPSQELG